MSAEHPQAYALGCGPWHSAPKGPRNGTLIKHTLELDNRCVNCRITQEVRTGGRAKQYTKEGKPNRKKKSGEIIKAMQGSRCLMDVNQMQIHNHTDISIGVRSLALILGSASQTPPDRNSNFNLLNCNITSAIFFWLGGHRNRMRREFELDC